MEQTRTKACIRRWSEFWHRYINGTRGVISLFLAILMVPFLMVAGSLVNAGRINSAVAIFDEALCNASNSTLGTYDSFLKKRFGLLAMSQNYASYGSDYTPEKFLEETFKKYMEVNLGALSNTYTDRTYSVTGLYPLADNDVLYTQIMEYGKYTIPTELVINGLSIDSIISGFLKGGNVISGFMNAASGGLDCATNAQNASNSMQILKTNLDNCAEYLKSYKTAYDEFVAAINEYNRLVDERATKIAQCEARISTAEADVPKKEAALQSAEAAARSTSPNRVQQLLDLENEKDAHGNKVDNSEKIAEFKEEYASELAAYLQARSDLATAKTELTNARNALETEKTKYKNLLSTQRTTVNTKKSNYSSSIKTLASSVKTVGESTTKAQSDIAATINSGVGFVTTSVNAVATASKSSAEKNAEKAKSTLDEVKETGTEEEIKQAQQDYDAAKAAKAERADASKNTIAVSKGVNTSVSTAVSSVDNFTKADYINGTGGFSEMYQTLTDLKVEVDKYKVSQKDEVKTPDGSALWKDVAPPINASQVQEMMEDLAESVAKSSFIALGKAIIAFFKALFNVSLSYDPELYAVVDGSYYADQGGLPSKRNRARSEYSLKSPFDSMDSAQSAKYKKEIGGVQTAGNPTLESESDMMEAVNGISDTMNEILDCMSEIKWWNVLWKIGQLLILGIKALGYVIGMFIEGVDWDELGSRMLQRLLVAGYMGYNTANRRSYTGKALTGAGYKLPSTPEDKKSGIAFAGAETEYIINGSASEKKNQEAVYKQIFAMRIIPDAIIIFTSSEIQTIVSAVAAIPVVGGVFVFILYVLLIFMEPLIDAFLLVNGGKVPMIKTKPYLSPTGIVDLVKAMTQLAISKGMQETIYGHAKDIAEESGATFPDTYEAAQKKYPTSGSTEGAGKTIRDALNFDYSKMLIIILLLRDPKVMTKRLGDLIQMEATFDIKKNGIGKYNFNLDKAYTHLRVAGSFETNEFIKLSDSGTLRAKKRVVYRGY